MDRIIIVSNRLPVTIDRQEGDLIFHPSAGGLATGLNSLDEKLEKIWIGWPGKAITKRKEQWEVRKKLSEDSMTPIFLTETEVEMFYEGFSNKTIWPHFHYFPQYTEYDDATWEAYRNVNRKFADLVISLAKKDDIIWVHDYQLMLVPNMIRQAFPNIRIGFFLHIPFPSYELFRVLPWRKEILEGIIGSDLVGFHIFGYMRHFLSSVYRLLGHEHDFGRINLPDRAVHVDVFPMGIDYYKFAEARVDTSKFSKQWDILQGMCSVLSIDRLDYSKGIKKRLEAFEEFLTQNPQYQEKVSLVMIVVPSRSRVPQYKELKEEIDTLVGRINGQYSTFKWTPVIYFYRSFGFEELSFLYRSADIALITPLRDGMNLVAKEFVASKKDSGVLILSEMAGASKELGEAVLINPNDRKSMINALKTALEMPPEEQAARLHAMQEKLKVATVDAWARGFLKELAASRRTSPAETHTLKESTIRQKILPRYVTAKKRLIVLDYDGTLMPFMTEPDRVVPDQEVLDLLQHFIADDRNKVVLSSGRDRQVLEKWLDTEGLDFSAEHGVWTRKNGTWSKNDAVSGKWKKEVGSLLEHLVQRTPGSFIEEKEYALAWHYRTIDRELGMKRVREFKDVLSYLIANHDLQILEGNKVIEIKSALVNKGKALLGWLHKKDWDFVLVIGDDSTDEDMFAELQPEHFGIKVGEPPSAARYHLHDVKEVRQLLHRLG